MVINHKLDKAKFVRELKTQKALRFYLDNDMADYDYNIRDDMKYDNVLIRLYNSNIHLEKNIQDEFIKKYGEIKVSVFHRGYYKVLLNKVCRGVVSSSKGIDGLRYLMCQHKYNLWLKGKSNS